MERWTWVSFATAKHGMGCRLNRFCENDSLPCSRLATNLPVAPPFVPEICGTSRLCFSRGGWVPWLTIGLWHAVKQKGSGQILSSSLPTAQPQYTSLPHVPV